MGTDLDVLAVGNCLLKKEEQNPALKRDYSSAFAPD
jgi:carbamoyltransferase